MPQRRVEHPTKLNVYALYGWDRALEFFVTVFEATRRVAEYDRVNPGYRDMQGALEVLAEHGFFEPEDIALAGQQLAHFMPEDFEEPSLRRCAEVIVGFRRTAD